MVVVGSLLALAVLSGCATEIVIDVRVDQGGAGIVAVSARLDKAALDRLGDPAANLRLDDLGQAGWSVTTGPVAADGSLTVRAVRRFVNVAEANVFLSRISAPDGPVPVLRLDRHSGWFSTTTRFSATVDLRKGLSAFADPDLTARLGGETGFGVDTATLAEELGGAAARALSLRVRAELPHGATANWPVALGEQRTGSTRVKVWHRDVITPLVLAALAAAIGLALIAGGLRSRRPVGKPRASRRATA